MSSVWRQPGASWRRTALCVVMASWCALVGADEPAGQDIAVRNVYVPQGDVDAWPTEGKSYLSVEAEQLETLLQKANDANQPANEPRVLQTVLYASIDADQRLAGRGSLECDLPSGASGWLSLSPTGLDLRGATWREGDASARLGYWGPQRGLALEVTTSGWLDFDWHAAPRITTSATSEYRLAPGRSLANYLLIDLPTGQSPDVSGTDSAVVFPPDAWDATLLPEGALAESLPSVTPDKARWMVRWESEAPLRLRLRTQADPAPNELRMASYQEQLVYQADESGVELRQVFDIAGDRPLPRLLTLSATPGLVIRNVTWDGRSIELRTQGISTYELTVPPAADGESHELVIEAWHSMTIDALTPLPQITLPQLFWVSGRIRVVLDAALQVSDLAARSVEQVRGKGAPSRQVLQFEKWTSRGRVELAIAPRPATNTVRVGKVLRLDSLGTTATVTTLWRSSSAGPVRLLKAKLTQGWDVKLVAAQAPFVVDDWYVEGEGESRQLVARVSVDPELAGSVDALRLTIDAQRPAAANMGWRLVQEYDVLEWQDARVSQNWMAIDVQDGYQLETVPPQQSLPVSQIPPTMIELLPGVGKTPIYDRSLLSDNLQLQLAVATARLTARVTTTVDDRIKNWSIAHRIECTPEAGSTEHVDLRLHGSKSDALRWRLEGDEEWQTAMVATAPRVAGESSTVAEFQLDLPRRQSGPFVILFENYLANGNSCAPSTVEVVEASELEEWVEVRSPEARDLRIETSGWQLSQRPSVDDLPLHSSWLATTKAQGRKLVVSRGDPLKGLPLASIRRATLESTYLPQAASQHQLTLLVENSAEEQLSCTLPPGATNVRWRAANSEGPSGVTHVEASASKSKNLTLELPLSETTTLQQFVIDYAMPSEQLVHGEQLEAPWPSLSLPAESAIWDVGLPSTYRMEGQRVDQQLADWRRRLFGPLVARPELVRQGEKANRADGTFHRTTLLLGASGDGRVKVIHQPTTQARLAVTLLLTAILSYWLWRRSTWLVVLLAVSFAAALLLPTNHFAWATAVWGGVLLGIALRLLEQASQIAWQAWTAGSSSRMKSLVARTMLVVLILHVPLSSPTSTAAPGQPVVESVLVPVDSSGRIASSKRYVSSSLLSELLGREQQAAAASAWVVSKPKYTGSLSSATSSTGATASVGRWNVTMDLEVLRAPATIRLPFELTDAAWLDVVHLDGLPVPIRWSADGHQLEFDVDRPGKFRLRLEFQPLIRYVESNWAVQLSVPPLAGGQLLLETTSLAGKLRVDGLELAVSSSLAEGTGIPLPSSSQLLVEWPQHNTEVVVEPPSVQRWEWLSVTGDRAVVDGVFKFDPTDVPPSKLQLLADGMSMTVPESEENESPYEWKLMSPVNPTIGEDGSAEIRFQIECERATQFGRLRVPELSLSGTTTEVRYMALSESPELAIVLGGVPATDTESLAELASLWMDRDEPSQLVRADRAAGPVIATIRPVAMEVTPEESLQVLALDDRLQVIYRGSFDYSGVDRFSQSLAISRKFEIDSVELLEGESSRPVDFSRAARDRLLVLYATPPTGAVELKIVGWVPLDDETSGTALSADVPRVTAALDAAITQQIGLYAADHLIAEEVQGDVEPELAGTVATPPEGWQAYGVKSLLTSSDRSTPLVVLVEPNVVKLDADILTTLVRRDNAWIAEFAVLVDVSEGNLPQLTIDWPASLVGTPEIDGPVALHATLDQVNGTRRLQVRLNNPATAGNPLRLVLRSAVRLDSPNRLECPLISVRGASNTERYFGLLEDDMGEWSWQRAEPSVAPASIEGLLTARPSAKLLKATSTLLPIGVWTAHSTDQRNYSLPLATIDVRQTATDSLVIATQFVVPALELPSFDLLIPEHQKLIDVTVDDRSAIVVRKSKGRLGVAIPDPHLPHVLQVITERRVPESSQTLELPQLIAADRPCEVQHRVWRMGPLANEATFGGPQADKLPAVDIAALRLNQLLSTGVGSSLRSDRRLPREWAVHWIATLQHAEQSLRSALAAAAPAEPIVVTPDGAPNEYNELLARATSEIHRTRTAADLTSHVAPSETAPAAEAVRQEFVQADNQPLRWVLLRRDATDPLVRWALALSGALVAGVYVATRHRWRWPLEGYETLFLVVALLGLAWWFCLWPRALGLVLSAAAVVAWLRWNYLKRSKSNDTSSWL